MPFLLFVYGYPSSSPRAHCPPNKSVPTLRYTRKHGPIYIYWSMPVGTYRVQSLGFPKIVCYRCYNKGVLGRTSAGTPSSQTLKHSPPKLPNNLDLPCFPFRCCCLHSVPTASRRQVCLCCSIVFAAGACASAATECARVCQ